MSLIRSQPAASELLARYARLPASSKVVLQLKSLVFLPTGKAVFAACLAATRLHAPDGRIWSSRSVNVVIDELLRLGLLTGELACPVPLLHPVAVDAMLSQHGSALAEAVRRNFPAQHSVSYAVQSLLTDPEALQRLIRLAVYADDAAGFTASRDFYDRKCAPYQGADLLAALFETVPLAADWIGNRDPVIQIALFEAKLSVFLETGVASPEQVALIAHYRKQQEKPGFAAVRPVLIHHDLLALQLDDVRRGMPLIEDATSLVSLSFQAALAFLEGRNETALTLYRDGLKLRRKQAGKRKVFPGGLHGMLFLMALMRTDDAGLRAETQAGLDAALVAHSPYAGGFLALQALSWLIQGLDGKARALLKQLRTEMPSEPLSAACVALAEHAVDAGLSRASAKDLSSRFEQLRERMPLAARIYAEILAEVSSKPDPYETYLESTGQGVKVRFTQIIQARQPWQRALESLDVFLGTGAAKAEAKSAAKAKRLVWFVDPDTRDIAVAEQSSRGRDGWTDGRPVSMKRLYEQDARLDYLTVQDRAALRSIRKENPGWYDDETRYAFDTMRTIPSLIGHPALFDARHRSQPLEFVRYPLELVVTEQGHGYRVALSHMSEAAAVFLEAETPFRYRVIEFPQSMLAVQEIVGRRGLTVPATARDQLVALVRRNSPTLPIRDEIGAVEQAAREGQSAPVVQCTPYEEGLRLSLLVRPFGADGPAYVAGLGGRSALASIDGQAVRANRDLQRELTERNALVAACQTLRDRSGNETHELIVEDLEGCLDLLLELQAYDAPVSVEWPEGHRMQVSTVAPDRMKLRVSQDREWFSVDGTVALDADQVLEMRFLLERLDRAQGRFVPLGDGRFAALTRQMQSQLQRLAAVSEPHRGGRRVHATGAPVLEAVLDGAGEVKVDAAWTRQVKRIRAAEGWTPKLPATLQAELRDYQVEGFVWLSRLARWGAGACLADDMGLGKTVQAIAVMLDQAEEGPCLVVAPTSVCPNWITEMTRFAPTLKAHRFSEAGDRTTLVASLGPGDVLVCSYGLLHQASELLGSRRWQMVVLDEAQAIKNAGTKRAQASLALQADFRLALTGTPVENYLDEVWSLFSFVNPGLLGSREGFQKRFAGPIERDGDPQARQALRELMRPFLLRRTKATVLSELPPRTEQTMQIEMNNPERVFYEALRQRALESIAALDAQPGSGGKRKIHILAEITRLRRACCNPALIDAAAGVSSGKLEAFLELVDELIRNRHRALVFSQFVGHLGLVRAALDERGIRYEYLDGSTPSIERERRVAAFQAGASDLFLISLRAGGTGLNLTAADYVVHLDPWWNPAVEDQASDRAHRIGQERPVTIYRLIMQDSIEERILRLHRDKRDLASDLLEGTETTGRLSEEELLDLIRA